MVGDDHPSRTPIRGQHRVLGRHHTLDEHGQARVGGQRLEVFPAQRRIHQAEDIGDADRPLGPGRLVQRSARRARPAAGSRSAGPARASPGEGRPRSPPRRGSRPPPLRRAAPWSLPDRGSSRAETKAARRAPRSPPRPAVPWRGSKGTSPSPRPPPPEPSPPPRPGERAAGRRPGPPGSASRPARRAPSCSWSPRETSTSTRGRSRQRANAATFSRSVRSSPAPPAKYPCAPGSSTSAARRS